MIINPDIYTSTAQDNDASRIKDIHEENDVNREEDMFMTLFLKELETQDPLEPTSNSEMLAQMAQFNSLTELQNINKNLGNLNSDNSLADASNLIGKYVSGIDDNLQHAGGTVESVKMEEGNILVNANGYTFKLEDLISVTSASTTDLYA